MKRIFDGNGNILSMKDALGGVTTYTYNENNLLTAVTDPKGGKTTNLYTAAGLLASTTDAEGRTTAYEYDGNQNVVSVTDGRNNTTRYGYDALNRLASVVDREGHTSIYNYDAKGNLTSIVRPDEGVISYVYDKADQVTSKTDGNGSVTTYTTIAKDINHSIKILRAYLSKKTELKAMDGQENENELDVTCGKPIHTHALAVIDSIKNPFESMYLKQRYSNYYLIGVYTDEDQRQKRLINSKKFSVPDIKAIDQVEQLPEFRKNFEGLNKSHSESNSGENGAAVHETSVIIRNLCERIKKEHLELVIPFIVQNVSSCLESADIFINNSHDNDS